MAFRMRDRAGRRTLVLGDAACGGRRDPQRSAPTTVEWTRGRTWRSPRTGASYPVAWRVRVGEHAFDLEPLMDDAELDSRSSTGTIYWEGPVRARSADGKSAGRGYLELTGYGPGPPPTARGK